VTRSDSIDRIRIGSGGRCISRCGSRRAFFQVINVGRPDEHVRLRMSTPKRRPCDLTPRRASREKLRRKAGGRHRRAWSTTSEKFAVELPDVRPAPEGRQPSDDARSRRPRARDRRQRLEHDDVCRWVPAIMSAVQRQKFQGNAKELDLAYSVSGWSGSAATSSTSADGRIGPARHPNDDHVDSTSSGCRGPSRASPTRNAASSS